MNHATSFLPTRHSRRILMRPPPLNPVAEQHVPQLYYPSLPGRSLAERVRCRREARERQGLGIGNVLKRLEQAAQSQERGEEERRPT